ncbi:hypothetical protein CDAR_598441 [Caerostris darwini]|uniref:Uncharacterized protein n=1 Tax=Caerostris darwini TaxID=1538125 RepID=A0AAV4QN84_9ARAC|nr:hypothetical protein CDAR_598441 [Caerostris darwini]
MLPCRERALERRRMRDGASRSLPWRATRSPGMKTGKIILSSLNAPGKQSDPPRAETKRLAVRPLRFKKSLPAMRLAERTQGVRWQYF